ncbi:hypothetical protein M408DRAFT_25321 [Serendipita vermifera MAFF 305830]|uniref:F-box domain-containing protein n=1 Tax=Serendipita vermifera MAFF 305830 TaxID=933852 RepID=A0A0C3B5A2_SERVB|nr:hypothetical protein M408DRAFT_25321 [Serendipita vermifera MAFF 305830]
MNKIEKSALRLRKLTISLHALDCEKDRKWVTPLIFERRQGLRRVKKLTFVGVHMPVPWSEFSGLESICLLPEDEGEPSYVGLPLVSHLTLGAFEWFGIFSPELWNRVTHLVLKRCYHDFLDKDIYFPSLVSLSLLVGGPDLERIDAPNLNELVMRQDPEDHWYRNLEVASITPRIVHIDIESLETAEFPDETLEVFTTPIDAFSKMEALQIRIVGQNPFLPLEIVAALSGSSPEPCYPKLRHLRVLCPLADWMDGDVVREDGVKEEILEDMKYILGEDTTLEQGTWFEKIEVGWYLERDTKDEPQIVEWMKRIDRTAVPS